MRTAKFVLAIAFVLTVLFLGCQHAAMAYRLHREGSDAVLFPPTRSAEASHASVLSVAIKNVRHASSEVSGCDIRGDVISLAWSGTTANVSFHSQAFFATSGDQASTQTDAGMYVDPLLAIDRFRRDLADRQFRGCLQANDSDRLRRSIVENLPLPPAIAYFFQLGSYDITGYFDLTPDFRLQVTSPIYSANTKQTPQNLIGYETANYTFLRDGAGNRTRLHLGNATEMLIGAEPASTLTLRNELPFSPMPGYFRLLFMADETSTDRITRAILLSTTDERNLRQAAVRRPVNPDDFCKMMALAEVSCTVFPKNFGVSPELRVTVNRKDAFVRVGGMVMDALNVEGPGVSVPHSLKIMRPFQGRLIPIKFDPSNGDILRLVLLPGDQIAF